jgi:catechol 2,3-dioxygenase-like lactoylglutathione lyase family enzyme
MTIEINGMAHVILTVSRFDVARDFYRKLLLQYGMKPVFDGDKFFYCVGGPTAIGIEPCDPALGSERFNQRRVGLHDLCLRAPSREDVHRCAMVLKEMAATIIRGPEEGNWAQATTNVQFEDCYSKTGRHPCRVGHDRQPAPRAFPRAARKVLRIRHFGR